MSQSHKSTPKTQEQMLREMRNFRIALIALLAAAILAAAGCIWYFIMPHVGNISGTYTCTVMSDTSDMSLTFLPESGTYTQLISGSPAGSGTYTVHGDTLITKSQGVSSKKYAIEEDSQVLIPLEYLYDGEIPDTDTFEATASRTGTDNAVTTLEFFSDGTYTSTVVQASEDESTETTTVSHGTYTRSGDVISRVLVADDGTESAIPNLFVYKGQLCNYCFRRDGVPSADSSADAS